MLRPVAPVKPLLASKECSSITPFKPLLILFQAKSPTLTLSSQIFVYFFKFSLKSLIITKTQKVQVKRKQMSA